MQELSARLGTGLRTCRRAGLPLACSLLAAPHVAAQAPDARLAVLRAVGPHVSDDVVRLLATRAEPVTLTAAQFPDLAATTPARIITRLCGSVRDAYVREAARANGLDTLALDVPLGDRAGTFRWPACLYVQTAATGKQVVRVKPSDTAFDLYRAYTGGGGSPSAVARWFGLPVEALGNIKAGKQLEGASLTVSVPFVARAGTGADLVEAIRRLDPQGAMVNDSPGVNGSIVMGGVAGSSASGTPGDPGAGTTAAGPDCDGPERPFDPRAVADAYAFARRTARGDDVNVGGGRVEMAVVDNGFFGARARADGGNPFAGSPFMRGFFKDDPRYTIATAMVLGETLQPINYALGIAPTTESGHGTHVTGLMLGGPAFAPYAAQLRDEPWASITVLNVGRGARTLYKGAYGLLMSQLQADSAARIVNLSIAHDGRADPEVGPSYGNLFATASNTLFVAAAGNNWGADVGGEGIFPAAHGGLRRANVITVAAVDGQGRLAAFSNRGARSVDLGAPGCRVRSWIALDQPPVAMSGTSQAAPLVSFGAALLRSIALKASAATLKNRIIASGDLLPASERGATAYEVRLNIANALPWFHDALEVTDGASRRRLLGTLLNMGPVTCGDGRQAVDKRLEDLYAFKRADAATAYFFGGRLAGQVEAPCKAQVEADAGVAFTATHEVAADGSIAPLADPGPRHWPFAAVQDLVVRTPLRDLR